jgi:UDP-N-acetylglucosamine--N-acetylmuramyl-(pentapeptide) pyrophosphoryl-undecaprenol N-acetylglucosamine transferase
VVKRAGIPFAAIPAAGIHGVGARSLPGNLWKLAQGALAAGRVIRQFEPDVLFFTGGYTAPPVAFAGRSKPSVLFVPDIEPGWALKFISRYAEKICVTTEESQAFFPGKRVTVTGYPLRPELQPLPKAEARATFGLEADLPVLLVLGGSRGARGINRALLAQLPQLLERYQVLHASGELDWSEVSQMAAVLPVELAGRYHLYPYFEDNIAAAFSSADLVISRAGASTLGELPLFGLPAVLVPYPYAWRYQKVNADYLEKHGAAVTLPENRLEDELLGLVTDLLDDAQRLDAMRAAMRSLARPDAAKNIADQVRNLSSKHLHASGRAG